MTLRAWEVIRRRWRPRLFSPPLSEYPCSLVGRCNICGSDTTFFCADAKLFRESLTCGACLSTSRYRSIARGVLRAMRELRGVEAPSLAELDPRAETTPLRIYDTQVPFSFPTCAYPIPGLLTKLRWVDLHLSIYKPGQPRGTRLDARTSIQNLECLTFDDEMFDVVMTSDVMEHVRLADRAHREIARVVRPGGVYLFTVPHFRHRRETFDRVQIVDPDNPGSDLYPYEKEYHGDANSADGLALSYRAYGTDLDETLDALGFDVDYAKRDMPELGIMNTELFYCRKRSPARDAAS